jgi:hypothetical protein
MNTNQPLQDRLTTKIDEITAVIARFAEEYSVERTNGYVPDHIVRAVTVLEAQREVLEEMLDS